jgi:hypothetical protein
LKGAGFGALLFCPDTKPAWQYVHMFLLLFFDNRVLNIDIISLFFDTEGRASMNIISRQAVTGACLAIALMLGANAGSTGAPGSEAQAPFVDATYLVRTVQTCRDMAVDAVLDVTGELVARLKLL